MNKKTLLIAVFILVALAQLLVPVKMILDREEVLNSGKEFKFKTSPIDPSDPFRGKYIVLNFDEDQYEEKQARIWNRGETIYVLFTTDHTGFAKIESVSKKAPSLNEDFLKTQVSYIHYSDSTKITINFPFNRFYMEESKAYEAEKIHITSSRDTSHETYASVYIKNGDAVLKDVLIDEVSIVEIVRKSQKK